MGANPGAKVRTWRAGEQMVLDAASESGLRFHQTETIPRVGCAVVLKYGEKILMGIRGKDPNRGKWILPGGGVKFLEPLLSTVQREISEETGLDVEIEEPIGVYEIINPPHEHRVIVYWWAKRRGGQLRSSSDLLDARFLSRDEVTSLIENGDVTDIVVKVLRDIGWG